MRHAVESTIRRLGPAAGVALLAPVGIAAAPLWAVSALTRRLSPLLEPRASDEIVVEYAPEIGVRPRRNLDTYARAQDVFHVTTDGEGWRGSATVDDADIVVFGDSFAFGWGVDDDDLYANRVPGLRVKPIASPAYSTVHAVLWLRRLAPRLSGKNVVLTVFCGNDLADNLRPAIGRSRMPFVRESRDGGWGIVTSHVSPDPWTADTRPGLSDQRVAAICTPSAASDRVFAAADYLLGEAADVCAQAGAALTVVSIPPTLQVKDPRALAALSPDPARVDLSLPDGRLRAACAARGIDFVPLLGRVRPSHYWAQDMHWNAAGHRLFADVLADIALGPTPSAPAPSSG